MVQAWFKGVPKLVIIGPHCEGLLDNSSTFVIRMITDRYALLFNTEKDVVDFIRKHIKIFRQGKDALRKLIWQIKRENPHINDRPKSLYSDAFEGKTVIIHGRPGAGKGTQARLLQDLAGFKYFGSGHELRRLSNKLPKQGQSLGRGNLAKPVIINYLLTRNLLCWERFEPVVIDGSPKMPEEAQALMDLFELLDRKPIVIVIDIDEELSRKRIIQRRNCGHCEISFCGSELIGDSSCPHCGAALEIRPENADSAAINRIMDWYQTNVSPVFPLRGNFSWRMVFGVRIIFYPVNDCFGPPIFPVC
jgi:adenylate kinase